MGGWWIIAGGRGFEGLERGGGEGRGDYHGRGKVWMWPNSGSLWFQHGHGHRGTHARSFGNFGAWPNAEPNNDDRERS